MSDSPQVERDEACRTAYRDGLLTAAHMVRNCIGEHCGPDATLVIDVDEGITADKATLLYVVEALELRASRVRAAASAIEARSGETTKIGSTEGESAVVKPDAQGPVR